MNENILEDFKLVEKVPQEVIDKYTGILPDYLINIWKEYGFGTFLDGYIKIVNPDDYLDIYQDTVAFHKDALVIFVTGLCDYILCINNFIVHVNYRYVYVDIIAKNIEDFMKYLNNKSFIENILIGSQYFEAIPKHGYLEFDQAFGYVPLLPLGGKASIENMDKVKIIPHALVTTHFVGKISLRDED